MVEKTQDNTTFVVNETPKCNSFEFGKASFRHKVYYKDVAELEHHIAELKEASLFEEELK